MLALSQPMSTFPFARIESRPDALPVEVTLIAQLDHGAGDKLFAGATRRQRAHRNFIDQFDEPSARLGAMDLANGDASSLYTFAVGANGHPFHRHAGHRVFTAISGSGGARLRFSGASTADIDRDPASFVRALRQVDIPPDSLFTVRFGGDTWHQFTPLEANSGHPALFALSCHTNELGGALPDAVRDRVIAGEATIPALTELLPENVSRLLDENDSRHTPVAAIALSFDVRPAGKLPSRFHESMRTGLGRLRSVVNCWRTPFGISSESAVTRNVDEFDAPADDSLLDAALPDAWHHQDAFQLVLESGELPTRSASACLAALLDGFVENPPKGVSRLMLLRNFLIKPLGLRTSPLGCPAASLLSRGNGNLYASRFPVLAQSIDEGDAYAQVLLGADDKHLHFRSCASARVHGDGRIAFGLGTRVVCKNLFGHFYLAAIESTHRRYVAPAMLRMAVVHAMRSLRHEAVPK